MRMFERIDFLIRANRIVVSGGAPIGRLRDRKSDPRG